MTDSMKFPGLFDVPDSVIERSKRERCDCGHLRFNHGGDGPAFGHGKCLEPDCDCQRFTWAGDDDDDGNPPNADDDDPRK